MEENKRDIRRICQIVTTIAVVAILILLLVTAAVLGRSFTAIKGYAKRADAVLTQLEDTTASLQRMDFDRMVDTLNSLTEAMDGQEIAETLSSLHDIAAQLDEVDLAEMSGKISETMDAAREALDAAQKAMDAMDVEALSEAVENLKDVLEPLAKLANRF